MLRQSDPAAAEKLLKLARQDVQQRWQTYERLAHTA
jgi:hypothetical protein